MVFNSSEIHDVLEKYREFPREAFIEKQKPLTDEKAGIIATHFGDYYDVQLDVLKQQKSVGKMLDIIIKDLLSKNMDTIYETLNEVANGNENIDVETFELHQLEVLINEKLDGVTPRNVERYKTRVRNWMSSLKDLDRHSFDYLTSAEFLYDSIMEMNSDDYSPYILQYCRAVENELKRKLFIPFINTQSAIPDKDNLYSSDLNHPGTAPFANMVIQGRTHFTIGSMFTILSKSGTNLIERSPVIAEFYNYILDEYDTRATKQTFLTKLKELKDNYRNVAAHTGKMSSDDARDCKMLVGQLLERIIGFGKKKVKSD